MDIYEKLTQETSLSEGILYNLLGHKEEVMGVVVWRIDHVDYKIYNILLVPNFNSYC